MFVEDTDRKNVSKYVLLRLIGSLYSSNRFKHCWEAPAEGMERMLQIKTTWHRTTQAVEGPTPKVTVHGASCICSVRCVLSIGKRSVECTKIYQWNLAVLYLFIGLSSTVKLWKRVYCDACATDLEERFGGLSGQKGRL